MPLGCGLVISYVDSSQTRAVAAHVSYSLMGILRLVQDAAARTPRWQMSRPISYGSTSGS